VAAALREVVNAAEAVEDAKGEAVLVLLAVPVCETEADPEALGKPVGVREEVVEDVPDALKRGVLEANGDTDAVDEAEAEEVGVFDGEEERLTVGVAVSMSSEGDGDTLTEGLPLGVAESRGEEVTEGEGATLGDIRGERDPRGEPEVYTDSVERVEEVLMGLEEAVDDGHALGERDTTALRV
jgi:hypothetical protein